MNEERIQALETEVSRLNQIINVLLKQTTLLEKENAALRSYIGNNEGTVSNEKTGARHFLSEIPYPKTDIGNTEFEMPNDNIFYGNKEKEMPASKTYLGNSELGMPYVSIGVGNKEAEMAFSKTHVGKTEEIKPLPATLQTHSQNRSRLATLLSASGFIRVENSTLLNSALLLITFYNKSNSARPHLCSITGLSKGGLSKLIMSLKKRGYITRTGLQTFTLTPYALQLMQQCGLE